MTSWDGRRVLVTGATGMIGSALVADLLDAGAEVAALVCDHDPSSELYRSGNVRRVAIVSGRVEDLPVLERAIAVHAPHTVFHLGAQTLVEAAQRDPLGTFESNVRGTYNLLEACRRQADVVEGVVVASSDKAYGAQDDLPYVETAPLAGRHPYEVSKTCGDLLAQAYHRSYGVPVAIARCGNVYGPGDLNWSRIVPGTIRSCLRGERPVVRSDGTFVRDYIFLDDVVGAYMTLGERAGRDVAGEAFNFSDERPATVLEIVRTIARLVGREDLEPVIEDRAGFEIRSQYLCAAKARDVLGWKPVHDLESGLRTTIRWYRELLG